MTTIDDQLRGRLWRCRCGYVNEGSARCEACDTTVAEGEIRGGRPASFLSPPPATTAAVPEAGVAMAAVPPTAVPAREASPPERVPVSAVPSRRALWGAVALVILFNLVAQVMLIGRASRGDLDVVEALTMFASAGFAIYGGTLAFIAVRADRLGVRPVWRIGLPRDGLLIGAVTGGVAALAVLLLASVVTGRPAVEPIAGLLVATSPPIGLVVATVLLVVVVAPVLEELVFRGFLAEGLRHKGVRSAIWASAAAFSVAHLRLSAFWYFAIVGAVFGSVYFRRGLVGASAAHAAFNGVLVAAAFVTASVGGQVLVYEDAEIVLPPRWQPVEEAAYGAGAIGPSGASVELYSQQTPWPVVPDDLADALRTGTFPAEPGTTIDPESVELLYTPAGTGVLTRVTVNGEVGMLAFVPEGSRMLLFSVHPASQERAFRQMLETLRIER